MDTNKIEDATFGRVEKVVLGRTEIALGELRFQDARAIKKDLLEVFQECGLSDLYKEIMQGAAPAAGGAPGDGDGDANLVRALLKGLEKVMFDLPDPLIGILARYVRKSGENDLDTDSKVHEVLGQATESQIINLAKAVFGLLASPLLELISGALGTIGGVRGAIQTLKKD